MSEDVGRRRRGPKVRRFTAERRAQFVEVLRRTGNKQAAARAVGLNRSSAEQRRKRDADFAIACAAAEAEASRRLAGARGPFDGAAGAEFETIKRGRRGRWQIVATRKGKWCKASEEMFLAALRGCGNVAAAARAIGFSESLIWQRRRKWPGFAAGMEEALEEAEVALEFRLACHGTAVAPAGDDESEATDAPAVAAAIVPFDPEFALRFLKWREEKRAGRGKRARAPAPPGIEEVTERIVRKVEAIKRHRRASPPPDEEGPEA